MCGGRIFGDLLKTQGHRGSDLSPVGSHAIQAPEGAGTYHESMKLITIGYENPVYILVIVSWVVGCEKTGKTYADNQLVKGTMPEDFD